MELLPFIVIGTAIFTAGLAVIVAFMLMKLFSPSSYHRVAALVTEMAAEQARMAMSRLAVEELIHESENGVRLLTEQVISLNGIPVYKPNGLSLRSERGNLVTIELYELLYAHFNTEELANLAFELGIDFENVGGRTRAAQTREFVLMAARLSKITDLVKLAKRHRPDGRWPIITDSH